MVYLEVKSCQGGEYLPRERFLSLAAKWRVRLHDCSVLSVKETRTRSERRSPPHPFPLIQEQWVRGRDPLYSLCGARGQSEWRSGRRNSVCTDDLSLFCQEALVLYKVSCTSEDERRRRVECVCVPSAFVTSDLMLLQSSALWVCVCSCSPVSGTLFVCVCVCVIAISASLPRPARSSSSLFCLSTGPRTVCSRSSQEVFVSALRQAGGGGGTNSEAHKRRKCCFPHAGSSWVSRTLLVPQYLV